MKKIQCVYIVSICSIFYFVTTVCGLHLTLETATKLVNSTFVVLCRDEAGRSVYWKGPKGTILGVRTRPAVLVSNYGSAIQFTNTVPEDEGTYTCFVGKEKKMFNLTIERVPISFMDTANVQNGVEGKDVTLRCEVRGGNVVWSVDGDDIAEKYKDSPKFRIMGDGLLIRNLTRSDSKTYICGAFQPSTGIVENRKILLRVQHKPIFPLPTYASHDIAYGEVNSVVNLTCIVVADPLPQFKWERQGRGQITGNVFDESNEVSILQLYVDKSTFGEYKCTAQNKFGKLEKHFSLEEGFRPLPPRFIELKGRNSDLLDLGIHEHKSDSIEIPPGMETTGFRVQYKKAKTNNWKTVDFNITEDNSYPIEHLEKNTDYFVKAATRNLAGFSDYTNTSIFSTLSHASSVHLKIPLSFYLVLHLIICYFSSTKLFSW